MMAQLSVLVGLAGDLSSVPSTHFGPLTAAWNSSSGDWTLFWPPKATTCTWYAHTGTNKFLKGGDIKNYVV